MFVDCCEPVKNPPKPTKKPFKSEVYYHLRCANTFLLLSYLDRSTLKTMYYLVSVEVVC